MLVVKERFLQSKKREDHGGGDELVVAPHRIGIIDVATAKTDASISDAEVKRVIKDALESNLPMSQVSERISEQLPHDTPASVVAVYNRFDNSIYYTGELNARVVSPSSTRNFRVTLPIDAVITHLRRTAYELLSRNGIEPFADDNDFTRAAILPYLTEQTQRLANIPPSDQDDPYLSIGQEEFLSHIEEATGSKIRDRRIANSEYSQRKTQNKYLEPDEVVLAPKERRLFAYDAIGPEGNDWTSIVLPADVQEITLTSDGFPYIGRNLSNTMNSLEQALLSDPHCIHDNAGTKGVTPGNKSYDDMSYVRFEVK